MNRFEIKYKYTILHFDEYPILFVGKNYKSQVVVVSFIFEDNDENSLKYFHSLVNENIALDFLKRRISYLELLKNASEIFLVSKDINDNISKFVKLNFINIDKSMLPLPNAFCTIVDQVTMLKFEELPKNIPLLKPNVIDASMNRHIQI